MKDGRTQAGEWWKRVRFVAKTMVIAGVESLAGAAVWVTLLLYSRFYEGAAYSRLLPWLACYQLITVAATFGSSSALGKLIQADDSASQVYSFLPRYTLLNLPWTVPIAFGFTWAATRGGFAQVTWLEAGLAIGTGAVAAIQRSQQQVSVLVGQTRRYSIERSVFGLSSIVGSLSGAWLGLESIVAFFAGQLIGLGAVSRIRRAYPSQPATESNHGGLYAKVFSASWVFGVLSVFGWFSGLGATIVLSRLSPSSAVALYAQALAAVSMLQLVLGAATTTAQSSFLARGVVWDSARDRQLNRFYDVLMAAGAGCTALAILANVHTWWLLRELGLVWPPYIWVYLFSATASLTLYQRVMLRHQYDRAVNLSWRNLALAETLSLLAFGAVLFLKPTLPLAASAALLWTKTITLFMTHEPLEAQAQIGKVQTIVVGLSLTAAVCALSSWQTGIE